MVLNLVLGILLLAPLSAWGFSLQEVAALQQQASEKTLWQDPQWLRLGHYRDTFSGPKSPIKGSFFLSEDGSTNPKSELLKTIEVFFSSKDNALQNQCRYLARLSWLKRILEIDEMLLVACPEKDLWKRQLGAEELYLVFAASDLNSAGSSFGHTFLRAHNPKNTKELELLDYGINFAAITGEESGALYALKGLFGFYPGAYSMLPYYQKIREYTNLEGRNLWEYKLALSPQEVSFLIDHLLELDGSYSDYYFLSDNCSQQILELIEVAKPQLRLSSQFHDATIPLDTVKVLLKNSMLADERLRMSLQAEWRTRYTALDRSERRALKEIVKTHHKQTLEKLNSEEKAHVLEASLSYLAIQEYRDQKDLKNEKYALSVARARLGKVTDPLVIPKPESPLLSSDSMGYYFGIGQFDQNSFYRFKFRRAFHDLLANDSGLSPFSHLEILSFDFRYFPEFANTDLYEAVLLKTFSTAPINTLDTPVSWRLELGTLPKMAPYLNFGAGFSFDFPVLSATRLTLLGISENSHLAETARPHLGVETLFMTKTRQWRALLSVKYLHETSMGHSFFEYKTGLATDLANIEFRFETKTRDDVPEFLASVIF
ncbi:MAG: hypothetical protein OM95_08330 [Bdellovibrio sp. ArHS]|uniref:Lnb N-terminal periplasmic domain-containing protein n=1 Tax=Bdellovibrio sp. ArHS TaxID=1569284 RepID=UPI000582A4A0|nr:DUF4105 domain-containing protein [Bdellovibrio sp. ArHS]KHD88508.1 MAG: hypothetical protein OM95_08330 [Bdellovibrio sp. ArHS]